VACSFTLVAWQDIPQLWVQTSEIDFTLTDRVAGRDGVHALWAMNKDLMVR
jgi:hypothetical protein